MAANETPPGFLTSFTTTQTSTFEQTIPGASMIGYTTRTVVDHYHYTLDDHGNVINRWCGSRTTTTTTIIWTIHNARIEPNYDIFGP